MRQLTISGSDSCNLEAKHTPLVDNARQERIVIGVEVNRDIRPATQRLDSAYMVEVSMREHNCLQLDLRVDDSLLEQFGFVTRINKNCLTSFGARKEIWIFSERTNRKTL
jgi:hypothetical protein